MDNPLIFVDEIQSFTNTSAIPLDTQLTNLSTKITNVNTQLTNLNASIPTQATLDSITNKYSKRTTVLYTSLLQNLSFNPPFTGEYYIDIGQPGNFPMWGEGPSTVYAFNNNFYYRRYTPTESPTVLDEGTFTTGYNCRVTGKTKTVILDGNMQPLQLSASLYISTPYKHGILSSFPDSYIGGISWWQTPTWASSKGSKYGRIINYNNFITQGYAGEIKFGMKVNLVKNQIIKPMVGNRGTFTGTKTGTDNNDPSTTAFAELINTYYLPDHGFIRISY